MEQQNIHSNPVDVTKKISTLDKIKSYVKRKPPKKRLLIVCGVSAGVLLGGVIGLTFFGPSVPEPDPEPVIQKAEKPPEPETVPSPLTGIEVSPELAKLPIVAVMIENSIDARPQSGLEEAGLVFEAIAEGGITRFLAVYQESKPGNIGPIRSARPYYVQWAKGFNATYVHSGGSGEALSLIQSLGVNDLDHGAYGERVASRVSNRYAPHNVYTSMERIRALATEVGYTTPSEFTAFSRIVADSSTQPTQATGEPASTISFNISGANYNTSYVYDATAKQYLRNLAGRAHTDQDSGKQISPEIVVALNASYSIHPDGVHSSYGTIGNGTAKIFQNGQVYDANWSKPSETASLVFTGTDGTTPFAFTPGQMWVTAIPAGGVTFTP